QEKLKVPVGIIHSSVRGTSIEAWMTKDAIAEADAFTGITKRAASSLGNWKMKEFPEPEKNLYKYSKSCMVKLAEYMDHFNKLVEQKVKKPISKMPKKLIKMKTRNLKFAIFLKHSYPSVCLVSGGVKP
ncbi:MAG: hypothetical protein ACYTFY_10610, partial [Planctomycetota bacterium]